MTPEERARAAVDDARFPPAGSNGYDRLVQHIAAAIRDAEQAAAAREREACAAMVDGFALIEGRAAGKIGAQGGNATSRIAAQFVLGEAAREIRARGAR